MKKMKMLTYVPFQSFSIFLRSGCIEKIQKQVVHQEYERGWINIHINGVTISPLITLFLKL